MPGEHERRTQTTCLLIIATVAIATALYWLRPVMVPFMIALFIWTVLTPLFYIQTQKLRFPHLLAVVVTIAIAFLFFSITGTILSKAVGNMTEKFSDYQGEINRLQESLIDAMPLDRFGVDKENVDKSALLPPDTVRNTLLGLTNVVISLISQGVLIMIFVLFMLIGTPAHPRPAKGFLGDALKQITGFLMAKLWMSLLTGVLVWLSLHLCKVDFAIVFGVFAFLLNFIPNIGSIIASVLPIPIVLLDPDLSGNTVMQVIAIAVPGVVEFCVGNLLEPRVVGKSLGLHPITILLSLIFWGVLWGIQGMFLAMPITAIIKILLEKMELTRPIAALLAGRIDQSGLEN